MKSDCTKISRFLKNCRCQYFCHLGHDQWRPFHHGVKEIGPIKLTISQTNAFMMSGLCANEDYEFSDEPVQVPMFSSGGGCPAQKLAISDCILHRLHAEEEEEDSREMASYLQGREEDWRHKLQTYNWQTGARGGPRCDPRFNFANCTFIHPSFLCNGEDLHRLKDAYLYFRKAL